MAKIKISQKNKIEEDEFSPIFAKERISIWIDEEVLDEFRKLAKSQNTKYQTMINSVLREYVFAPKNVNLKKVIEKLEAVTKDLKKL